MRIAWFGLIIETLAFVLLKPFINDFEVAAICFIGINMLFFIIGVAKYKKIRGIFYSAYIMRIIAMFWDIYARHIFTLPHSGADSEGFFYSACLIANDLCLMRSNIYGGLYSKILGGLFYLTYPERLLGQYRFNNNNYNL